MARGTKKDKAAKALTPEEKLAAALVPVEEQPYKVPGNWCWVKLGTIAHHISDGSHNPPKDSGFGVPLLSATNIHDRIIDFDNAVRWITQDEWALENERTQIEKGDVLLTIVATIGRVALVKTSQPFALQRSVATIKPKINSAYLSYYLETPYIQVFMNFNAKGTAQKGFYLNSLEALYCAIPPLAEQQRIVDRIESLFAKLDEAKEKAQAVVDGFEDRKAAILHKAFTGELTQSWRKANKVDYSSWKTKTLSETSIQIIDGDRGKNYPKKDEFFPEGYCIFLSAKNVTKRGFVFDECECITKEKDELLHNGRLERGDMVMTTRGTIGNVAIYDDTVPFDHLRINSGMVIYRGGSEFVKQYLIWLYQSKMITNQIDALRTGTAQPQLPIKVMNALQLPIPPLAEQTEIVRTLDRMIEKEVNAKEAAEQTLTQIDTMKKAILARAFRGELGTNDPTDDSAEELLKQVLKMGK